MQVSVIENDTLIKLSKGYIKEILSSVTSIQSFN